MPYALVLLGLYAAAEEKVAGGDRKSLVGMPSS
jgi:hypothetical protein